MSTGSFTLERRYFKADDEFDYMLESLGFMDADKRELIQEIYLDMPTVTITEIYDEDE